MQIGSVRSKPIIETIFLVVVAILVAIVVRFFLLQLFYIPSGSMEPTLQINDNVFVNKMSYQFNSIERGDIVVLVAPESVSQNNEEIKDLIKRIVGLPGETIEGKCSDGVNKCKVKIYITKPGGMPQLLKEPYLSNDPFYTSYAPFDAIAVPNNSVLLLGDNRANSSDGRVFGPVNTDKIIGRAFFRIWPIRRAGLL
ncbi:MAG: signal peptidase I [Acidimicrobiia bacterium]